MLKKMRKRVRRNNKATVESVSDRLRVMFADSFSFSMATLEEVDTLKSAVSTVAWDTDFWEGLKVIVEKRVEIEEIRRKCCRQS